MKFTICQQSTGRMRVRMAVRRMTLEEADRLEAFLAGLPGVVQASVHERTCCAVIRYTGPRQPLTAALSRFSYAAAPAGHPLCHTTD